VRKIKLETHHTIKYSTGDLDIGGDMVVGEILTNGNFLPSGNTAHTIEMLQDVLDIMIDLQGSE